MSQAKFSTLQFTPRVAPLQARPPTTLPEKLLPSDASADLIGTWGKDGDEGGRGSEVWVFREESVVTDVL